MYVKIGGKIYSSGEQPIYIMLSDEDKESISNMTEDQRVYASYPSQGNFDSIYIHNEAIKFKKELK